MPPQRDLQRISVIVDAETKRALERLARQRSMEQDSDINVSELVREALDEYLARPEQRRALRRVAESLGVYRTDDDEDT